MRKCLLTFTQLLLCRVRTALAGAVVALPADALSARIVGLLAFGLSRSASSHSRLLGMSSDESVKGVVRHLAGIIFSF
jgi:hypothetical protein